VWQTGRQFPPLGRSSTRSPAVPPNHQGSDRPEVRSVLLPESAGGCRRPIAVPNPQSRRRAGGAAALLELLAAAARTVVVAADFWRQARLAGNARMVAPAAQQPFDVRCILGLALHHARDHLPTTLSTQINDGLGLFGRAYPDHGGPLVSSQFCQSSPLRSPADRSGDSLAPVHRLGPSRLLARESPWPA
jgi:hypothetical protein